DCVGDPARQAIAAAGANGVVLLENLRFHAGEEANDEAFARQLAELADVYGNDAFGAAHRGQASTEGMVRFAGGAAAGLLMANEVGYMGKALTSPDRPFVAVLGGAKVSDKLEVIQNLLPKVDALIIGGAMAYTFLKAQGLEVGRSLVEADLVDTARELIDAATTAGVTLALPGDHVVAEKLEEGVPSETLAVGDAAIGQRMGLDIGPETAARYAEIIRGAKTVVWNGPMGVFEIDAFAHGTKTVADAVAAVDGVTIIGGGDSIAAVTKAGVADRISHISTGGGASLEFLGGRTLPGVAVLPDQSTDWGAEERPMRVPLIAGNWKMFKGVHEAVAYAKELRVLAADIVDLELVLAPPFTAVSAVADALRNSNVAVAGQDLFWEKEGAFTGAVSGPMLQEAGAALVIVGHSERRRVFGDTDAAVNRKVLVAYGAGLVPIVCVGETLDERDAGRTFD